jgi:hypothetical protein
VLRLVENEEGAEPKVAGQLLKELLEECKLFDMDGSFHLVFETDEHNYLMSNSGSVSDVLLQLERSKYTLILKSFGAVLE